MEAHLKIKKVYSDRTLRIIDEGLEPQARLQIVA